MKKNVWIIYDPKNDIIEKPNTLTASRDSTRGFLREWKRWGIVNSKTKVCKATIQFNEKQKGK